MIKAIYHRQSRTVSSEQYQVTSGDDRLGYLDLHFGSHETYATLVLERELPEDQVEALIEQIDDDLVEDGRDDFLVRVFIGRELALYSDEFLREEEEYVADGHEGLDG